VVDIIVPLSLTAVFLSLTALGRKHPKRVKWKLKWGGGVPRVRVPELKERDDISLLLSPSTLPPVGPIEGQKCFD